MDMSYITGGPFPEDLHMFSSVKDVLKHFAVVKADQEAVVFCSTDQTREVVTWKELYEKSATMARAYLNLGVKPGECIAVVSRTRPEWLYVTFGAMLAGACVTSVVFTYADGHDVIDLMEKIGNCALIILDPGVEETNWCILKNLLDDYKADGTVSSPKIPYLRYLVFIQPPRDEADIMTVKQLLENDQGNKQLPEVNPHDTAYLFQTSGSTGIPKLVAHTYESFLLTGFLTKKEYLSEDDIFFNNRLFTWAGGFPFRLLIGQKRVTSSGLCPKPANECSFIMDVIKNEGCTAALLFPHVIYEMAQRHELPANWPLKTISTIGQPVTKSATKVIGRICESLNILYGSTELMHGSVYHLRDPSKADDYQAGYPLPGIELKIVNKEGEIFPRGERGEICARSPCLFKEFINDKAKTDSVMTFDGWYKTDDYRKIDKDGCLFIEGRVSDMIICGGMNVAPSIIESVLKSFPGVKNAVVVPVPDAEMYQVVCACVCVETGSDVTEGKLRDFMESVHNDKQKLFTVNPKFYIFLPEFPEESNGKISKKALKLMAKERFGHKM